MPEPSASLPLPPSDEKIETDSSLRAVREKADEELLMRSGGDQDADQVIEDESERTDELVDSQRLEVDIASTPSGASVAAREEITVDRATEDAAVTADRIFADEKLAAERVNYDRAMNLLFALERERTDERLSTERSAADRAVVARDELLAMVSHDIRGILGAMAATAELFVRALPAESPASNGGAASILRLTSQASRLVGDLMDVVRLETGRFSITPRVQDASTLLAETIDAFGRRLRTWELT